MQNIFEPATKEEWLARAKKDLKGAPLESLDFQIGDLKLSPFHHASDVVGQAPPIPGMPTGHSLVGIKIDATTDPEAANLIALDALAKGADLLLFVVPHLDTLAKKTRKLLLAGILTDIVTIVFAEQLHAAPSSPYLFQEGSSYHFDALQGDYANALYAAMETFSEEGAYSPTLHVGVTDDYFASLATLRAARLCWWRISESFSKPTNARLIAHVRPNPEVDAHHNKISATTQAMSAIIGGADGLVVMPSDGNGESVFSRRVALNLQHLLEYEAHLPTTPDAAAGSYFLEQLTDQLAEAIWSEFQSLFNNPLYKL